jgi:hypothetical protein
LSHLCKESGVVVPVLLDHDRHDHVLIISDLGLLPNLSECFSNLSSLGLARKGPGKSVASSTPDITFISRAEGLIIGQKIGSFFAGLHQPKNVAMVQDGPYNDARFLTHDGMLDMVLEAAIRPVKEQLRLFPQLLPQDDVSTMYQWVEENFTRTTEDDEKAIALGDCWTGALLVGPGKIPSEPQVGIIDWEFASIGRGVNGDMAQLLAHLHLFQIAAAWQKQAGSLAAINAILQALTAEYRRRSRTLGAPWLAESASLAPEPYSLTARIIRSAFLAHGAEMINNAFWKEWVCRSHRCCDEKSKEKQNCKLIQAMVEKGWWYLFHARQDETSFVDEKNWDKVRHERIILPMFFDVDEDLIERSTQLNADGAS